MDLKVFHGFWSHFYGLIGSWASREDKRTTSGGKTALHVAALGGHLEICRLLLASRADAEQVTSCDGARALDLARRYGHGAIVELLLA